VSVGVIFAGGPYQQTVAGLRDGLKELGLEDGKRVVFEIHDTKGDSKAAETAAAALEQKKVDLIFSLPSSVSLIAQRATTSVPIVFYAGSDPVESGLVKTYANPGGRLKITIRAANACPMNRPGTDNARASSVSPSTLSPNAATNTCSNAMRSAIPGTCSSTNPQTTITASITAMPPPCGVGIACEERAFGVAIT